MCYVCCMFETDYPNNPDKQFRSTIRHETNDLVGQNHILLKEGIIIPVPKICKDFFPMVPHKIDIELRNYGNQNFLR